MKRAMTVWCAALAVILVVAATPVHAQSIPWSYGAAGTTIDSNNNPIPTSSVTFAGSSGVASGDSGIIIYKVTTKSTATDAAPDSFFDVPFNLAVTLSDAKALGSGSKGVITPSGTVKFSGLFSATNVTDKSLLPGGNSWTSPTVAEVTLGADDVGWRKYTVQISSFTPPGQPGGDPGSIQAIVTITPTDGPGGSSEEEGPNPTPEPASAILAGLGLPLFFFMRRRMKQN